MISEVKGGQVQSRVLIVDDDPFTRTVLVSTLEVLGYVIVGSVGSAKEAVGAAMLLRPELALVDLDLGEGPTGIYVARSLRKRLPSIGLVVLSTYSHPRLIGGNQSEMPPGTGYVVKSSVGTSSVLDIALQRALNWQQTQRVAQIPNSETVGALENLTDLQIELLRFCASGYSNAEIARRRSITEASVEKSIYRLMRELGIQSGKDHNPRIVLAQIYYKATGTVSSHRD